MSQLALPGIQPGQPDHSFPNLVGPVPLIALQLRKPNLSLGHSLNTRSVFYPPIQFVFGSCTARNDSVKVDELSISFRF